MKLSIALLLLCGAVQFAAADEKSTVPVFDTAALEKKIHQGVNQERKKCSLPPFAWDDRLAKVARAHSKDMATRDYLNHNNPEGEEPMDRVRKNGFVEARDFVMVAENIFKIDTVREIRTYTGAAGTNREIIYNPPESVVRQCVSGWMKSPGHRKNLLNGQLEAEGIGVVVSDKGEIFITEVMLKRGKPLS
jgi:uncharacterized protein YkwD